ncbi:ABC transporter permease [Iodidimonas muriae]|uniref:ABC transporter permease n=1 Tax=Iodidimonas muriae TaxID=261467 RepID=A0ABQ2L7Z5_9PROT|nr:hypothetical protein [Iodidimonas muriae]GGO06462.1 ABC transporter permease [Iodidimonas muriae]
MSKFLALAKRELIEHRTGIVYAPAIITGLMLVVAVASLSIGAGIMVPDWHGSENEYASIAGLLNRLAAEAPLMRGGLVVTFLSMMSAPALLILPFVIFFILLGSLYEERRDRSFLFWKSMPVSDTQEVLAKVAAGMVLAPLVFLVVSMAMQVLTLLVISVIGGVQGGPVWTVWQIDVILINWLQSPLVLMMWALWSLPVFAWVLFCGAYAPRAPFMYAVLPPVVVAVAEGLFLRSNYFITWIGTHLSAAPVIRSIGEPIADGARYDGGGEADLEIFMQEMSKPDLGAVFSTLGSVDLWIGLAIAAGLIYGAIWFRRYNL